MADPHPVSSADRATFLRVVEQLRSCSPDDPVYVELERAVSQLVKSAKKRRQRTRREERAAADRSLDAATATFEQPIQPDVAGRNGGAVGTRSRPRRCYICKREYRTVDAHYHLLCSPCADRNRSERSRAVDLSGRTALVTGGRIKIGFQTALRLLRAGATVVVTTRFPVDAQHQFALEPDADEWTDRLTIVEADFLHSEDVARLTETVFSRLDHLDILVNNAAQTIARPPAYYRDLVAGEHRAPPAIAATVERRIPISSPELNRATTLDPTDDLRSFVPGLRDETGQPLDLRTQNSWRLELHEIDPAEWVSCHIVGAFVPWLLIRSLRPLLLASPHPARFVVNVSAMEGVFTMRSKTPNHPHTNATKAALNMVTRTSGASYASDGIHMCAVDTGWITDENPHPVKTEQRSKGFRPPLDVVDGAARVCHPIFSGLEGSPYSGVFLKDYEVAPW